MNIKALLYKACTYYKQWTSISNRTNNRIHIHTIAWKKTPLLRIACSPSRHFDYVRLQCNCVWYSHSFHFNPPIAEPVSSVLSSNLDTFTTILSYFQCMPNVQLLLFFFPRFLYCSARAQNQHVKYIKIRTHTRLSGHGRTQIIINHSVPSSHFDLFNFSTPYSASNRWGTILISIFSLSLCLLSVALFCFLSSETQLHLIRFDK